MTATCHCGRPVDGAYLCSACTHALRSTLDQVPMLVDELDVTLTRQAVHSARSGPRSSERPLPFDAAASEAAWILRNTIGGWCRVLDEEHHATTLVAIATADAARWLAANLAALRGHPAAGEAHEEITAAASQATRHIDQPAHRARIPIGPCPETDEHDQRCDGAIVAYIPSQPDRPAVMHCGRGHTWETIHWRSVARRITATQRQAS